MAAYLKRVEGINVSHNYIAGVADREHDLQPHRQGTFKLSTDPDSEAKVMDVVGLYLAPPEDAIVLSFDEKTQVQAGPGPRSDATVAADRLRQDGEADSRLRAARNDDLFAALNVGTSDVIVDR